MRKHHTQNYMMPILSNEIMDIANSKTILYRIYGFCYSLVYENT